MTRQRVETNAYGKDKVVRVLKYAPRNEDVLGEWRYSATHS